MLTTSWMGPRRAHLGAQYSNRENHGRPIARLGPGEGVRPVERTSGGPGGRAIHRPNAVRRHVGAFPPRIGPSFHENRSHMSDSFDAGRFMKYLLTNHFGRGSNWTPEKLAAALRGPLGQLGVTVELTRAPISAGFQAVGLSADAYKRKHDEVGRVVRQVMSAGASVAP